MGVATQEVKAWQEEHFHVFGAQFILILCTYHW